MNSMRPTEIFILITASWLLFFVFWWCFWIDTIKVEKKETFLKYLSKTLELFFRKKRVRQLRRLCSEHIIKTLKVKEIAILEDKERCVTCRKGKK